ncbi:MAG: glycosyltransferase family 4 protein [Anaerolineae bacterium]|nr:glycosyltransferase family 4 protein [Thermoflexales bacterium]MDW8408799.1 glycosyltransferase family 4 protein [Anaerolineae bacterium]
MRVLLVITAREVGGAELYVEHLARALQGRVQFTIALPDHPNLRAFTERLSAIAETRPLPLHRPAQWTRGMPALRGLARAHDVIHLNSNHPGSRLGIAFGFALSGLPAPLICVEHRVSALDDIRVLRALKPILPALFRLSRRGATRIIAVSRDNAEALTQLYGIHPARIEVIHNGVDLPVFDAAFIAQARADLRTELGIAPNDQIVLTLARLAPNKGHCYLIEAMPEVIRRFPNVHFVFAGAPDEQAALEQLAGALNVRDRLHLLGFRTDAPRLLAGSNVFALPSLGEGLPLSVIEALAAGLPVVATRVGGVPEVIRHGENGLLVPPADTSALRDALLTVLSLDEVMRARWQEAARQTASLFTAEEMAIRTMNVYRSALKHEVRRYNRGA